MSTTQSPPAPRSIPSSPSEASHGLVGRLGVWAADHFRVTVVAWLVIAIGLGALAPRVETALSGAGWEASGSESVLTRAQLDEHFGGASSSALAVVVHSSSSSADSPQFESTLERVRRILDDEPAVGDVRMPMEGSTISPDGKTAVVIGTASGTPTEMVAAADRIKEEISAAGTQGVRADLTGSSGMWADFNEANRDAMLRSELISWPITLAILVLAFGSLVAAGLPLMLTILGLASSAGLLYLGTHVFDISIWAMNFALMFALALGIDYALFVVHRFRGATFGSGMPTRAAIGTTMDTAGKAVLFSGVTVLVSLSAVMLVPSPAFRSMAAGIMASVLFVLLATLTLLPAVLGKLGPKVDALSLPWAHSGEHRSKRFERWGQHVWSRPLRYGLVATALLVALAIPALGLRTGMPSIKVVPEEDSSRVGYHAMQDAFGTGAPGALQVVTPTSDVARVEAVLKADRGIAQVSPAQPGGDELAMIQATPNADPSSRQVGTTIDRLRTALPDGTLVGGAVAENHDLEEALATKTPLVIGVVLVLGFLLLLVALQAPLIAALGVITNLLAVAAAFGIGRLIFQDGHGSGFLGFESQGYLDAWAPVFFFAMIFAISMDYTVFLLSSAREHYERSHDAREAMIGGVAHSGRVIFAAAAVMVAVFFTFALSGPLPPKEMGIILGIAVLLDALLIRLLLMPVLLRLFGDSAWALPRWLGRILPKVTFGH